MPNLNHEKLREKIDRLRSQLEANEADYHYQLYLLQPCRIGDRVLNRVGEIATVTFFHASPSFGFGFWLQTADGRTTFEYGVPVPESRPRPSGLRQQSE